MLNLESVYAKIDRAETHSKALEAEFTAWLYQEVKPYRLWREVNSDFTRHSVGVDVVTKPPIDRWGLMLGDAIHNLRSALDHLIYAISVHQMRADPPPNEKTGAFVIKDRPEDFRSNFYRIKDLSLPVQRAVESVQPYNRPHPTHPPLLGLLRDFDDADKHRLLKIGRSRPVNIEFHDVRIRPTDFPRFETCHDSFIDRSELGAIVLSRPEPELKFQCHVAFTVCVEHTKGPGPTGVIRTGIDVLVPEILLPEVREVIDIVRATATP